MRKISKDVGGDAKVLVTECDVSRAESVAALADFVRVEAGGQLDCVVVNAGYAASHVGDVTTGSPADFADIINTNLLGCYHAAHYLIPVLLRSDEARGGKGGKQFFAIGSMAAWITGGEVPHTAYAVSKYAQGRIVEMVSEQFLERSGLLALTVHPGGVRTDMGKSAPDYFQPSMSFSFLYYHFCPVFWVTPLAHELRLTNFTI